MFSEGDLGKTAIFISNSIMSNCKPLYLKTLGLHLVVIVITKELQHIPLPLSICIGVMDGTLMRLQCTSALHPEK
jgi:hypothetical protein